MSCSVKITKLYKSFYFQSRTIKAVENLTIDANVGEIFGILGANGSGKTTLLKMLCGLITPTSGNIYIFDNDINTSSCGIKFLLGFISAEDRNFYGRLSGRQNLEFFFGLYGRSPKQSRKRIDELFELLEFTEYSEISYQKYSSGNKQKLAIARALLHNPKILLIDELNKSLDPVFRPKFIKYLKHITDKEGKTVILTTHILNEAEVICDRAAILDSGKLIQEGSIKELTNNGSSLLEEKYSQLFI